MHLYNACGCNESTVQGKETHTVQLYTLVDAAKTQIEE